MKRKNNPSGFRKRRGGNRPDHNVQSGVLRKVRAQVQGGNFALALASIDSEVSRDNDSTYQSKLLMLAADCFFKQGKFSDAADAYGKICVIVQNSPVDWLFPALAQVRSLLKAVQVTDALVLAGTVLQTAIANQEQYEIQLAQVAANVNLNGQATIPAQPASPVAVASRLGKLFLAEGEVDAAKSFFQQALQINSNACQTRIGLAEIALLEGDAAAASTLATDAIKLGNYQAKTLPAWLVLLAASHKSGVPIDAGLIGGLASALPSVRARATLELARGLRRQNDSSWKTLATNWLQNEGASNSTIAAELKKLVFADTHRISGDAFSDQLQAAQNLLNAPGISPMEWLAATKQIVRISLLTNQSVDVSLLVTQGMAKYGSQFQAEFTQSLAMACKRGNRVDLATQFLQQNLANATGDAWRKTLWSLAKIQGGSGNHADAANSYWTYAQNNSQPQRFRAYALMRYALELFYAQKPDLIEQAAPQLQTALAQIQDYEVLLDVARQLRYARFSKAKTLAENAYQRGKQMALQAFDSAGHPSVAANIIFKFSRRAFDFSRNDDIIATWLRLDAAKQLWLWSKNLDYWNWQELILRAYLASNQLQKADNFGGAILNDSATPAEAVAIVGATYLTLKRQQNDFSGLFSISRRMAQDAPGSERTAIAYYWLALRAWKENKAAQTKDFADKMLLVLGKDCQLFWKGNYRAAAYCFKASLDLTQIPAYCPASQDKLQQQLQGIQNDLADVSNSD